MVCFFAERPGTGRCAGPLQRAHWIKQQTLTRELGGEVAVECPVCEAQPGKPCWSLRGPLANPHQPRIDRWLTEHLWNPAAWAWMCERHHRRLDHVRDLRVARADLPEGTERYAAERGLEWWLEREYGPKEEAA